MQPRPMTESSTPSAPSFREASCWVVISVPLASQPFRLRGKVTGDALIEPALELGGQVKKFDSHGKVPCKSPTLGRMADGLGDASFSASSLYIAYLADRFQYLSVNIS